MTQKKKNTTKNKNKTERFTSLVPYHFFVNASHFFHDRLGQNPNSDARSFFALLNPHFPICLTSTPPLVKFLLSVVTNKTALKTNKQTNLQKKENEVTQQTEKANPTFYVSSPSQFAELRSTQRI